VISEISHCQPVSSLSAGPLTPWNDPRAELRVRDSVQLLLQVTLLLLKAKHPSNFLTQHINCPDEFNTAPLATYFGLFPF